MSRQGRLITFVAIAVLLWPVIARAQYTVVLKNGRRITVQAYRDEGQTIKIYGIGGEIGMPRDQIQSILKAGEGEGRGADLSAAESPGGGQALIGEEGQKPDLQPKPETPAEQRAREESEYQKKLGETTQNLKAAMDRYAIRTKGSASSDPSIPYTDDQVKARNDDLVSRLRDVQHNPAGPSDAGGLQVLTPSPFTGQPSTTTDLRPGEVYNPGGVQVTPVTPLGVDSPPSTYSEDQKELSDLRGQIYQLEKERQKLIDEMKQKNFATGSLFLE